MTTRLFTLIVALVAVSLSAWCQNTLQYVVQRGETMESVAQTFGVSLDEMKAANPDMELFYTGLQVNVPVKQVSSGTASQGSDAEYLTALSAYKADCEVADNLFRAGQYRKAQKQYKTVIEQYSGVLPCNDALYGNALCSYNREKWKSAIEDLSAVINCKDSSPSQRAHCKRMLAQAQELRDQQLENRANFWGGLVMTAAQVGTAVAVAASQPKPSASSAGSSSSSYSSGGISYSGGDGNYSSGGSGGASAATDKSTCPSLKVSHGRYYCANTGRCGMCGGDGLMDSQDGLGVNNLKCTLCGGSGKCKYCR